MWFLLSRLPRLRLRAPHALFIGLALLGLASPAAAQRGGNDGAGRGGGDNGQDGAMRPSLPPGGVRIYVPDRIYDAPPPRRPRIEVLDSEVIEPVRPARPRKKAVAKAPPPPARPARPAAAAPPGPPPSISLPAAGENRLVPQEVLVEARAGTPRRAVDAIARRERLSVLAAQPLALTGSTLYRLRIADRRDVPSVLRALEREAGIAAAQPNYTFALQQGAAAGAMAPMQYALAKMRLPEAHGVSRGEGVLVGVIDSGVDAAHPELAGTVAESLNVLDSKPAAHAHGTAMAGIIASRAQLVGVAPQARLATVRAFAEAGGRAGAEGTSFHVVRGLDWLAARGAKVVNLSFAGPQDALMSRVLAAAGAKGIVLVAAAGNAGPAAAPLYPAAEPGVLAVTAIDASDRVFERANRGRQVAVAAPGVDVLVAAPAGGYTVSSGTSAAAAHVSGLVALLLARSPALKPDGVRAVLQRAARDLGEPGTDEFYGAGLVEANRALEAGTEAAALGPATPRP